jgi:hypothetical protein
MQVFENLVVSITTSDFFPRSAMNPATLPENFLIKAARTLPTC